VGRGGHDGFRISDPEMAGQGRDLSKDAAPGGCLRDLGLGTAMLEASMPIVAGVLLFALSDVFVARDRFVKAEAINAKLGLPIYFAAQLLLASSVG